MHGIRKKKYCCDWEWQEWRDSVSKYTYHQCRNQAHVAKHTDKVAA